jgi:hypothetical protein
MSARRFFLLIGLFLGSLTFRGQELLDYNHTRPAPMKWPRILKISPGNTLLGPITGLTAAYGIIYETPVAKRQSIQVGCAFIGKGLIFRILENASSAPPYGLSILETGMEFQFAYKFYLSKKKRVAPKGWYAGPLFHFTSGGVGTTYGYRMQGNYIAFEKFDANLIYGCQLIRKSGRGLVIDWYVGGGYKQVVAVKHFSPTYSAPYGLDGNPLLNSPFNFILGLNIGWGFCPKDS